MSSNTWDQTYAIIKKNALIYISKPNNIIFDVIGPFIAGFVIYVSGDTLIGPALSGFLGILLPFCLICHISGLLKDVVFEKSERYKEYLKIQGLSESSYLIGILSFAYLKTLIIALIIFIAFAISKLILDIPEWEIFVAFWLFAIASTNMALFLTVFFTDPTWASNIGGFVYTIGILFSAYIEKTKNEFVLFTSALIPPFGFQFFFDFGILGETYFTFVDAVIMFTANTIIYLILYLYFDQVWHNDYGIKRDPCFCLKRKEKKASNDNLQVPADLEESKNLLAESEIADNSSAKFLEAFTNTDAHAKIILQGVNKSYEKNQVLFDLTMTIHQQQIFCILGHNGAGKTTAINILTGLIEKDSGKITYSGQDFDIHFDEIRKSIGLCTQKDILYQDLTVKEHLELMARLKGVTSDIIENEIKQVIGKVGLNEEINKKTSELSGGNRRKLMLAMSFIGNVDVIFLDEPTSGMDANARRDIWSLLRELKNEGKTLILTTHHLDEADELADRLAVLAKGKLFALGTSDFIKKKFGDGYHLIVNAKYGFEDKEKFDEIKNQIIQILNDEGAIYTINQETASDTFKANLGFAEQDKFPQIFGKIESIQDIQISLEMNSLEDAFINIGLDEEKYLGNDNKEIQTNTLKLPPQPSCLTNDAKYVLSMQFRVLFKRQWSYLIVSFMNMLLYFLPICYMILSASSAYQNRDDAELEGEFQAINYIYGIFIGYGTLASTICAFPVYEREKNLKYALRIMGCRSESYWLATFIFDFIMASLSSIALLVSAAVVQSYYITSPLIIANIIAFQFALITQAYAIGFFYNSALTVLQTYGLLYIFVFSLLPFILAEFSIIFGQNPNGNLMTGLFFVIYYSLSPSGVLFMGILRELDPQKMHATYEIFTNPWETLIWLILQGLAYSIIGIYFENHLNTFKKVSNLVVSRPMTDFFASRAFFNTAELAYLVNIDVDAINNEYTRVTNNDNHDPVKVIELSKVYDNFEAVSKLTFGVEESQIFGLLGPNGAGKSTTFNVLTGMIPRSEGSMKLLGIEIDNKLDEVFLKTGVCPQIDCLYDFMTVKEHLALFGHIKGLNDTELNEVMQYYLELLQLKEHENKTADTLSGGNKRRLCVANALIGSPSLLFFDEPSTGLDPLARKYLWHSIHQITQLKKASVLFTTHSISEAETLCHKIGIMINGKFTCLGSVQYLKNKYGLGYKIILKRDPSKLELDIEGILKEKIMIESLTLVEKKGNYIVYQVSNGDFSFKKTFSILEELKKDGNILDFSIFNSNLEQVFLMFAKYQTQNI